MKRFLAVLLALALMTGIALAEQVADVNAYVERQGYKIASVKNKTRLTGCWFTEGVDADTLQWSDQTRVYTVSGAADTDLRALYGEIAGMYEWDTCTYTVGDKVQFAYNAPEITAVKSYKTLKNYIKYLGEYLETRPPVQASVSNTGKQVYILNTSSRKFHFEDCASAKKIKKANRERYTGKRSDLIAQGYEPCKKCNP